jgi:hypothetical protein
LQNYILKILSTPDEPEAIATSEQETFDPVEGEPTVLRAGLKRYIASQYFSVAKLLPETESEITRLMNEGPDEVKWDAAVILSYHGKTESYDVLSQAILAASKSPRFARAAKLAAIALGEAANGASLEKLIEIVNSSDETARIRAIYWGLRVYGLNEGDWKLTPDAKTVYPILNKIADDLSESVRIRGFAKKSLSEITTMPGQEPSNKVVEVDPGALSYPIFTGRGKHMNDIIRENLNLYEFPPY